MFSTPWRIPQAVAKASAGQDALTKCGEMSTRARTYRDGADGYGTGARQVAMTGHASDNDGQGEATTGTQLATTGKLGRRRVVPGR